MSEAAAHAFKVRRARLRATAEVPLALIFLVGIVIGGAGYWNVIITGWLYKWREAGPILSIGAASILWIRVLLRLRVHWIVASIVGVLLGVLSSGIGIAASWLVIDSIWGHPVI